MSNGALHGRAQKALAGFVTGKRAAPPWENRKVVIYGAGGFGRDLASALLLQPNVTLLGFLDQRGSGQTVLGDLNAYSLESTAVRHWMAEKPIVILGVLNPSASLRDIKRLLTGLGFSAVVTPMEAYLHVSKEMGWRYWLGTGKDYSKAADQIEQTRALWADSESERMFLETLLFRLQFDLESAVAASTMSLQYADPSLPPWAEPLTMVDGGAYTGDTFQSLGQRGHRFAAIHAFEPDAENFQNLCITAKSFNPPTPISLWPCGLWSSTGRMSFAEGGGTASKLSEAGKTSVPVVALDDVLHGQAVNLIKLDIEGAEPDALQGARRLIEKNRPGLAICLYHSPDHLWTVPLWVHGLNLDYNLYYRAHLHNTFETVLYAIPQNQ